MDTPLRQYTADHQSLLSAAAEAAGFTDPVAFRPEGYTSTLLWYAVRGRFVPLANAFTRSWESGSPRTRVGMKFGLRLYDLRGVPFVRVEASEPMNRIDSGYDLFVVDRKHHQTLFRNVLRVRRTKPEVAVPVMAAEHKTTLWQNTIDFLHPANLKRIKEYGGRAKRGLLLTGPPGNGKTSACRWIQTEAVRRGWSAKCVSPDDYQAARRSCNPAAEVRELFEADGGGVVFFDDLDIALRDRTTVKETDDQAVFLSALDGIRVTDGVVYVFTTNCPVELIDPAFRRPGRIDLTLHFPKPDAGLRTELVNRWHADLRAAVGTDQITDDTAGLSFAEIEELKNLLVLRFIDAGTWDWQWAREQFHANRDGLADRKSDRSFGFIANGKHG
jgi:hypothetical protein